MDKDDAKARGFKHRVNKRKYNKNKLAAQIPQPKPRISLDSNWDRYEAEEACSTISSSTDFAVLSNAPITHGSHFQFKSDKDSWDVAETLQGSDLFKLDLVLLEKSLSTIPFNMRCGIGREYFSEGQHRFMSALTDNAKSYQEYLRSQNKQLDVIFGSESEEPSDSDEATTSQHQEEEKKCLQEPILEVKKDGDGDLEQWLDDILDD